MIEYLEWDSSFFGLKIGRCFLERTDVTIISTILAEKASLNFDLVYVFSANRADTETEKLIEQNEGLLVDVKLTYITSQIASSVNYPDNCALYTGVVTPELQELALASGHKSRFKKDVRLQHKYSDLYSTWIQKSVTKEIADAILVHTDGDTINGFVSVRMNGLQGQIGLIAVADEYRGNGIGNALMNSAHTWYAQNCAELAVVVTQDENVGACKLYESFNYSIKTAEYIYHL